MATETNRNAVIGSIKAFIERSPILGVGHKDKDTIALFNLLIKYEDHCTAQYENGSEDYLELAKQLKSLSGDLKRKCPSICNYTQRIITENYKAENVGPLVDAGEDISKTIVGIGGSADAYSGASITATASDSDGYIKTIKWTYVSGPGYSKLTGTDTLTLGIQYAKIGVHVFQITVIDNEGASASDTVSYTVIAGEPDALIHPGQCTGIGAAVPDPGTPTEVWTTSGGVHGGSIVYTDRAKSIPFVGTSTSTPYNVIQEYVVSYDGGSSWQFALYAIYSDGVVDVHTLNC